MIAYHVSFSGTIAEVTTFDRVDEYGNFRFKDKKRRWDLAPRSDDGAWFVKKHDAVKYSIEIVKKRIEHHKTEEKLFEMSLENLIKELEEEVRQAESE